MSKRKKIIINKTSPNHDALLYVPYSWTPLWGRIKGVPQIKRHGGSINNVYSINVALKAKIPRIPYGRVLINVRATGRDENRLLGSLTIIYK